MSASLVSHHTTLDALLCFTKTTSVPGLSIYLGEKPWGKKQNNNLPHFQPEQHRSLYNAKMFPVVHPFDVLIEDAGKDDIFWLAYTGVSEVTDQQKINRSVLSISN